MKRNLFLSKLKPEKVQLYKSYHENVWPELESAYKKSGIKVISCFLHDTTLAVYAEIDETVFEQEKSRLAENDFERKWQQIMHDFTDSTFQSMDFEEVYRLE
jgi:L-rhamnose mutarotase